MRHILFLFCSILAGFVWILFYQANERGHDFLVAILVLPGLVVAVYLMGVAADYGIEFIAALFDRMERKDR